MPVTKELENIAHGVEKIEHLEVSQCFTVRRQRHLSLPVISQLRQEELHCSWGTIDFLYRPSPANIAADTYM